MIVLFKHKGLWYTATGKYDEGFEFSSIDHEGEEVLEVIESLGLIEDFEESVLEYI